MSMQGSTGWEHFEHGADIGVRGYGPSRDIAFVQIALALTAVVTDLDQVVARDCVAIECTAPDDESLLYDWLNALIYEMATRRMLFSRFDLTIHGQQLVAVAWGESVDIARHHPVVEIKGATYTELKVHHEAQHGWWAQCVVDV